MTDQSSSIHWSVLSDRHISGELATLVIKPSMDHFWPCSPDAITAWLPVTKETHGVLATVLSDWHISGELATLVINFRMDHFWICSPDALTAWLPVTTATDNQWSLCDCIKTSLSWDEGKIHRQQSYFQLKDNIMMTI